MTNDSIFFPLEDCIRRLKRINHLRKSPPDVAQVYDAALGFFCHLKKEQVLLYRKSKADGAVCSPLTETPAIAAVLSDPRLFMSLIRCLRAPPPEPETDSKRINVRLQPGLYSLQRPTTVVPTILTARRKRGLSIASSSDEPASKVAKTNPGLSPMMASVNQRANTSEQTLSLPIQIIAASIFYLSLRHIHHWPAPLLHAYAEDAFGPRLWVDRTECECLVANLRLAHDRRALEMDQTLDHEMLLEEAQQVAHFYANLVASVSQDESDEEEEEEELCSNPQRSSYTLSSCEVDLVRQASAEEVPYTGDYSDSGEEEVVDVGSAVKSTSRGGDDSSSSGEEEVLAIEASNENSDKVEKPLQNLYPFPLKINLESIRLRYFGVNLDVGLSSVTHALSARLETKTKQNSRLLQTLPDFCTLPGVRSVVASNLEKWLQSPALSGAARTLFSSTVLQLKECDPPLAQDLDVIDAFLDMHLKANQFNAHIENITQIAKQIPTQAVSRHIFLKLLRKEMALSFDYAAQTSEFLKMMCAVHLAFTRSLSHDGLASAILTLLAEPSADSTRREQRQLVLNMRMMLRRLLAILGLVQFDGCGLIESLLSSDFKPTIWSASDEEDRGRIVLECVTLLVPNLHEDAVRGKSMKKNLRSNDNPNELSDEEISKLKRMMLVARKLLIKWCVTDYLPLWQARKDPSFINNGRWRRTKQDDSGIIGAGCPDFTSVLDSECTLSKDSSCPDVVKCVLFMLDPESIEMQEFLSPEGSSHRGDSLDEMFRVRQCYRYGADFDDAMLALVLAAAARPVGGINTSLALALIEHLFACCKIGRHAQVLITDANLVWEMYKLAEYHPLHFNKRRSPPSNDTNAESQAFDITSVLSPDKRNGSITSSIPRLARPGSWWRITALALVVIGGSPSGIGSTLCKNNPTLLALTKMVTSGRYRFPTVDCDDVMREEMKKGNSDMRLLEAAAAELLFLPTQPLAKTGKVNAPFTQHGSRASARQRQRQEDKLREQREKEAAITLAVVTHRKKMLKAAQKSIMVCDMSGPARKPPKESMNLIRGAERMFGLSDAFQRSENPDLVKASIGDTSRGAIERAYTWLIPVISSIPSVINRLPANASCFLLLRVYGTESEGDSKLRELSDPLLQHIRKTVTGAFGPGDANGALNILLADVADKKPARRRCARRVLEETLSELNKAVDDKSFAGARCTWLYSLLLLEHIDALLPDAISHVSNALMHERGRVLRACTLALNKYINVAARRGIQGKWDFAASICNLLSSRQSICTDALSRFSDLRELAIQIVYDNFTKCLESKELGVNRIGGGTYVQFAPCRSYGNGDLGSVRLPLSLLQSACVVLSIWEYEGENDDSSKALVHDLANILMSPFDSPDSLLPDADGVEGVASATMIDSKDRAVSVDEWVMLAKSRSDNIARRAALSAPAKFLPRLLLCSGLPKSSLLTMIDRVGKLGEKVDGVDKVYRELLTPSVTMEWGFGQIGTRREIARKLLGRLSAYISISRVSLEKFAEGVSLTFIQWLAEECRPLEKLRKGKKGLKARVVANIDSKLADAESLLSNLIACDDRPVIPLDSCKWSPHEFKATPPIFTAFPEPLSEIDLQQFVKACCSKRDSDSIDSWIATALFSDRCVPFRKKKKLDSEWSKCDVALLLLDCSLLAPSLDPEWIRVVERWVPLLSSSEGNPSFWKVLFSHHESELNTGCIVTACANAWCPFTSMACRDWIISSREEWTGLDVQNVISFLLQMSGQCAPHAPSFQRDGKFGSSWFQSKESVDSVVHLALACASLTSGVVVERNDLPAWLQLLLLVAQAGKLQTSHISQILLEQVEQSKGDERRILIAQIILRIYCYFPNNVSLGNPMLRTILVDASKSVDWCTWRTPIDETLNDMLAGLKVNPTQRLVHGLVEVSKSHPLMLLRKLDVMADILEEDAMTRNVGAMSRTRFQADDINGAATAIWNTKEFKVVIRHWGYGYSDPLWVSFIEILLSVPREVLFSCGMKMGLNDLLLVYVKLFFVQCHLQNCEKASRLRSRFSDLTGIFETDTSTWNNWLSSKVPSIDSAKTVRSVLVRCSLITADQATNSVRHRSS